MEGAGGVTLQAGKTEELGLGEGENRSRSRQVGRGNAGEMQGPAGPPQVYR